MRKSFLNKLSKAFSSSDEKKKDKASKDSDDRNHEQHDKPATRRSYLGGRDSKEDNGSHNKHSRDDAKENVHSAAAHMASAAPHNPISPTNIEQAPKADVVLPKAHRDRRSVLGHAIV